MKVLCLSIVELCLSAEVLHCTVGVWVQQLLSTSLSINCPYCQLNDRFGAAKGIIIELKWYVIGRPINMGHT